MKFIESMQASTVTSQKKMRDMCVQDMIAYEKDLVRRIITAYAADGAWHCPIDELWPQNIQWLKDEGFTVVGNEETGYVIWWGSQYEW